MLFFVMYDIENNKVRRYVVKYLEHKGCTRVQKSIFLADLSIEQYQDIRNDLAEVQAVYENKDSILVVPISTDYLKAMKVIGQNVDIDIIMHTRNTLFFWKKIMGYKNALWRIEYYIDTTIKSYHWCIFCASFGRV